MMFLSESGFLGLKDYRMLEKKSYSSLNPANPDSRQKRLKATKKILSILKS